MSMPLPHTPPSLEFFNDLYHRFLLSPKPSMKSMCLQAMAIVYGQCWEEIGAFNDTKYMVYRLIEVGGARGGVQGCMVWDGLPEVLFLQALTTRGSFLL